MNTSGIPWHLLQSFAAISDAGSLSRAAVSLGSSQPTLSRHLTQLEEQLGTRLFFRTAAGLTLTPEGDQVRTHAETMAQAAAQLSIAGASAQELSGTVRITASQVAATYLLPPMLVSLKAAYPALSLEVVASDETDNLLRREADLAIRMYRPTQNDLISKMVAKIPMGIYATRDYFEKHGKPANPSDLEGHTIIGYDRSTLIIDGMKRMGINVDRSFFSFRSDDQVVCWQMVLSGMGIGFGQKRIAEQHPDLVPLWPELTLESLPVWLTAHQELRMSPRVRASFDHLADCFAHL